jgi:hypothetical protein
MTMCIYKYIYIHIYLYSYSNENRDVYLPQQDVPHHDLHGIYSEQDAGSQQEHCSREGFFNSQEGPISEKNFTPLVST